MTEKYIRTPELLAMIRRVLKALVIVTGVVGAIGVIVGALLYGSPGVWAALIAAVIGIIFTATTVVGLYLVAGRGEQLFMVVLLGGWLVKMAILGGVIFWLRNQSFYHKGTFVATIIALVISALIVEMVIVATARIPYVSVNSVTTPAPQARPGETATGSQAQDHAESEAPSQNSGSVEDDENGL